METIQALSWLQQYQPLPNDTEMTQEIADMYDQVRLHFIKNPDSQCIPLFLNSFGGRNGWGVYQLVEDVLRPYSAQEVLPHLLNSLQSPNVYVRQWSAYIASNLPDSCLIGPLSRLLADYDEDVKSGAIIALQQIQDERVKSILELYCENETDEDLRDLASTA